MVPERTKMQSMSSANFTIPDEFASDLQPIAISDLRSDEEILQSFAKHVPVTSEKNIWAFWDKGVEHLPSWCQQNVCDWVRICTGWTIRILDAVPTSPNYALKFLSKEMLPQAFVNGEMTGPYVGQHSADFLRGGLLYLFGGVYMDVGCILLRHVDRIAWTKLESPDSPYRIAVPLYYGQRPANHFVMSRKGDPFIKRWHDLFVYLWQDRRSYKGFCDNPLVAFGANVSLDEEKAAKFKWDFTCDAREIMEYIGQVLAWQRLTMLEDAGDDFSCTDYWQHNVFVFEHFEEDHGLESAIGFDGQQALNVLTTSLDTDPESDEYKTAYRAVWRMLAGSCMQKVARGKGQTREPLLGILLDMPEHRNKYAAPGTFGALLRHGAVHFQQTRPEIRQMQAVKPLQTFKKGLYEPF